MKNYELIWNELEMYVKQRIKTIEKIKIDKHKDKIINDTKKIIYEDILYTMFFYEGDD